MEEVDDTSLALRLGISQEIHSSLKAVTIRRSALDLTPFNTPKKPSSPGHSSISSFSTATYIVKDDTDSRKKLRLTKQQSSLLEDSFKEHSTLTLKQKQVLANQLNLRPRQVEVWFQNRRARTKLKQKEIDLEFLNRCFERLKEENWRLHKELNTLKFAPPPPPLCMQLPAAATLAMCPSCERNMAGVASAGGFTATAKPPHLQKSISPSRLHVGN